ncbi:MAG: hypothetical protein P8Y95_14540 [Gammaproteobacteria bacterium]|jgi:hypothetical protein
MDRTHYIAITLLAVGLTSVSIAHPWVAILVVALLGAVTLHILVGHRSILATRLRVHAEAPPTRRP